MLQNRICLGLLCFVLIFALSACGSNSQESGDHAPSSNQSVEEKEITAGEALLNATSYADYEAAVREFGLTEQQEFDWYFVDGVPLMGRAFNFDFRFSNDEVNTKTAIALLSSPDGKLTAEEMGIVSDQLVSDLSVFLGYTGIPVVMVYDLNGDMLDQMDSQTFQMILDGQATLRLAIRQSNVSFWKLVISGNDGHVYCTIEHFVDNADYENATGDINLDI